MDFSCCCVCHHANESHSLAGIRSVYNPSGGRVDISQPDTALGPLPLGLCFQLVLTASENSVDPGAEDSDCVSVDESIPIPRGWSTKNLALVSYGNNVYSESSEIFGTAKGKDIVVHLAFIIRTVIFILLLDIILIIVISFMFIFVMIIEIIIIILVIVIIKNKLVVICKTKGIGRMLMRSFLNCAKGYKTRILSLCINH